MGTPPVLTFELLELAVLLAAPLLDPESEVLLPLPLLVLTPVCPATAPVVVVVAEVAAIELLAPVAPGAAPPAVIVTAKAPASTSKVENDATVAPPEPPDPSPVASIAPLQTP
jgi:hypothetical protein